LGKDEAEISLKARWVLHCAYQANKISEADITQLIKLDLEALLCENAFYFNIFELKFITDFFTGTRCVGSFTRTASFQ
jgi:hypothetical protein